MTDTVVSSPSKSITEKVLVGEDTLVFFAKLGAAFAKALEKAPYEDDWNKRPLSMEDVLPHLKHGGICTVAMINGLASRNMGFLDLDEDFKKFCEMFPQYANGPKIISDDPNRAKVLFKVKGVMPKSKKKRTEDRKHTILEWLGDGTAAIIAGNHPAAEHHDGKHYDGGIYQCIDSDGVIPEVTADDLDDVCMALAKMSLFEDDIDNDDKIAPVEATDEEVANLKATFDNIISLTGGRRGSNGNYQCHCPAHDDKKPSLSIKLEGTKILFDCHAGCDFSEIAQELYIAHGIKPSELSLNGKIKGKNMTKIFEEKNRLAEESGIVEEEPVMKKDTVEFGITTDEELQKRFVRRFGNKLKWTNTLGWVEWDGHVWSEVSDERIIALCREIPHEMAEDALEAYRGGFMKTYSDLLDAANKLSNIYELSALMRGARSSLLDERKMIFDTNPDLVNAQNCVINLVTGEMLEQKPEYLMTKALGAAYDPNAEAPTWEKFVRESLFDDEPTIDFIQQVFGVFLTGYPSKNLFDFFGPPNSGKSTTLRVLFKLLGSYYYHSRIEVILTKHFDNDGEGATPVLADYAGKRLVTFTEPQEKYTINEQIVNYLTGGDPVNARKLHKDPFVFIPSATMVVLGNYLMGADPNNDALWSRMTPIKWGKTHTGTEQDTGLEERLLAELPGILAWCVKGAVKWYASNKQLARPRSVNTETAKYRASTTGFAKFVEECVDLEATGSEVSTKTLSSAYISWCIENDVPNNKSKVALGRAWVTFFETCGKTTKTGTGNTTVVMGVSLK